LVLSSKVAIIIPTLNRIDFIIRTVRYYASINSNHPIYIGDASDQSSEQEVLRCADNNVEINYFHWKGLGVRRTIARLSEEALETSKYCAYHGDDDYFIPHSLSKCADFLEHNPLYATAQGKAGSFSLDRSGPYGNIKEVGTYWDRKELRGGTAAERLTEITSNYWVPIFSVHRTDEFIEDISNGIEMVIDRNFGELINVFSIAMRGRSKYIDCLYLIRNGHDGIDHPSHYRWISSEQWRPSLVALLDKISDILEKTDNSKKDKSYMIVENSVELYFDVNKDFSLLLCIRSFLKKVGLLRIAKLSKKVVYSAMSVFPWKTSNLDLLTSRNSKYYNDFRPVVRSLNVPIRNTKLKSNIILEKK